MPCSKHESSFLECTKKQNQKKVPNFFCLRSKLEQSIQLKIIIFRIMSLLYPKLFPFSAGKYFKQLSKPLNVFLNTRSELLLLHVTVGLNSTVNLSPLSAAQISEKSSQSEALW